MYVQPIERSEAFDALEEHWEAVWQVDPHATIFTSWGWLKGWMAATRDAWVVLAAAPGSDSSPVAFLPLGLRRRGGRFRLVPATELCLAGSPMSDHAGLLCLPGWEDRALPAIARAVDELMEASGAKRLVGREISDPRWDAFLGHFGSWSFDATADEPTPCPCVALPATWDAYMEGSRKRKSLLRRAEREGYLVTHTTEDTLKRDTDIFLELHQLRLGRRPPQYLEMMRSLLRWTHRARRLHLVLLWHHDTPAAANVAFLDRYRGTFHAYNGGWDEWFRKHSPRRILELHSIRCAIEEGFRTYDLGRGAEDYKFGFGAEGRFNRNGALVRRSAATSARRLAEGVSRLFGAAGLSNGRETEEAPTPRPGAEAAKNMSPHG